MRRKLKFRVWDTLMQRMIYPQDDNQQHFVIDLNGQFHNLQNGSGGNECVVQQFTGLKDLKGREIYEGDIILHTWEENHPYGYTPDEIINKEEKFVVKWKNCGFTFPDRYGCQQRIIENSKFEIIGNIFENSMD